MERKIWTPLLLHPCKALWWMITGRTRTCNLQSLSLVLSEFMYQLSSPVSSTNQQPGDHEHKKVTKSVICWAAATVVRLPTIQGYGFFLLKVLCVIAHKNILPRERSCLFQATQDEKYVSVIPADQLWAKADVIAESPSAPDNTERFTVLWSALLFCSALFLSYASKDCHYWQKCSFNKYKSLFDAISIQLDVRTGLLLRTLPSAWTSISTLFLEKRSQYPCFCFTSLRTGSLQLISQQQLSAWMLAWSSKSAQYFLPFALPLNTWENVPCYIVQTCLCEDQAVQEPTQASEKF